MPRRRNRINPEQIAYAIATYERRQTRELTRIQEQRLQEEQREQERQQREQERERMKNRKIVLIEQPDGSINLGVERMTSQMKGITFH